MLFQIEVGKSLLDSDPDGRAIVREARELGLGGLEQARLTRLYLLEIDADETAVRRIASELLADPVTEEFSINAALHRDLGADWTVLSVLKRLGVTDPVEATMRKAIQPFALQARRARTGVRFYLRGQLGPKELDLLSRKVLCNPLIEQVFQGRGLEPLDEFSRLSRQQEFPAGAVTDVALREWSPAKLASLSRERALALSEEEMLAVQAYFLQEGREPTDVELETIAQAWSEHCLHKTFRSPIRFGKQTFNNLLGETIMRVTKELARPWCLSVFKDNAGIIAFDEQNAVCFKVETHNHPSALEPYGGAGTGIGGVIRDCLGAGLGAKPIASTDVFCVGPPDMPAERVPPGVLSSRRILRGVVAGVRDYGNRMGIPTVNGAVVVHENFVANPLVFCGTVGILPRDKIAKKPRPGDLVVLLGGRTGRDGIHGATFSSLELDSESERSFSGAVQIGNAITEKKVADALLRARDAGCFTHVTDCGAGGLACAVGESARGVGAVVHLERVPLKYEGLSSAEIWISEAQERMILAVPPDKWIALQAICDEEDVEATAIGRFGNGADSVGNGKRLEVRYEGRIVGQLDLAFVEKGLPRRILEASWSAHSRGEQAPPAPRDLGSVLVRLLGTWNTCSKEWIIRQYDHEVQGTNVLKPLTGRWNDGPSDACVLRPVPGSDRGLALSNGLNPRYGEIDPYRMAGSVIDEALRNAVAVGGDPRQTALVDNFCWGNPRDSELLGALVRATQACYDVARAYETPFISGKDSLNNEFTHEGKRWVIPPTLLVSALAIVPDIRRCVTMDLKSPGNNLYLAGTTRPELGGSSYYHEFGGRGGTVPGLAPAEAKRILESVHKAISAGLVRACHDLSEGGLGVALAEMAFSGGVGARVDLAAVPREGLDRDDLVLFSESNSRFLLEVPPSRAAKFERIFQGLPIAKIGHTVPEEKYSVAGPIGKTVVECSLEELREAWKAPFANW